MYFMYVRNSMFYMYIRLPKAKIMCPSVPDDMPIVHHEQNIFELKGYNRGRENSFNAYVQSCPSSTFNIC